jgi:hypothetical protein
VGQIENKFDKIKFIPILVTIMTNMTNETITIKGNYDVTYEVSIVESRYGFEGQKGIKFHSSTFCGQYFLETIMFDDSGLPKKLDQELCIDGGQDARISGPEMAKARKWAWKQIKQSI